MAQVSPYPFVAGNQQTNCRSPRRKPAHAAIFVQAANPLIGLRMDNAAPGKLARVTDLFRMIAKRCSQPSPQIAEIVLSTVKKITIDRLNILAAKADCNLGLIHAGSCQQVRFSSLAQKLQCLLQPFTFRRTAHPGNNDNDRGSQRLLPGIVPRHAGRGNDHTTGRKIFLQCQLFAGRFHHACLTTQVAYEQYLHVTHTEQSIQSLPFWGN